MNDSIDSFEEGLGELQKLAGSGNLDQLFEKYGEDPPSKSWPEDSAGVNAVDASKLVTGNPEWGMRFAEQVKNGWTTPGLEICNDDQELGVVGTPFDSEGRPLVEQNENYKPIYVRGYKGRPADYDKFYSTESIIFDSTNSNTETLVSASWTLKTPSKFPPGQESAVRDWCEKAEARLLGITCLGHDFKNFVEHAAMGAQKYGFAPFEVVWARDKETGWIFPRRFEWREPFSIDGWVLDDRQAEMTGISFDTGPNAGNLRYVIPATGNRLQDHKVLLVNLFAQGNNYEGISPQRPSQFLVRLKRLLLQILGVGIEKHGVPLTKVTEDIEVQKALTEDIPEDKKKRFFHAVKNMRAIDANVYLVPPGLDIEVLAVQGQFPTLALEVLRYLDVLIAKPFSNEGSLLGMQAVHGSWALGEVKDRQDLRSAPFYARNIAKPINKLLRIWIENDLDMELPEYPELVMELDGMTDGAKWIESQSKLFAGADVRSWPEESRQMAARKSNLPDDAYETEEGEFGAPAPGEPDPDAEEKDNPEDPEEKASGDGVGGSVKTPEGDDEESGSELENAMQGLEDKTDYDANEKLLDRFEARLAKQWRSIAQDHRREWQSRIRDNEMPADMARDMAAIEAEYRPRYAAAAAEEMAELARQGGRQLLKEWDGSPSADWPLPPPWDAGDSIEQAAFWRGHEAFSHMQTSLGNQQAMIDSRENRSAMNTLALASFAGLSAKAATVALNKGRYRTMRTVHETAVHPLGEEAAAERLMKTDKPMRATVRETRADRVKEDAPDEPDVFRTAVLDSHTCDDCKRLDGKKFKVGSKAHRDNLPPAKCSGFDNPLCRCMMTVSLGPGHFEAVQQISFVKRPRKK